MTELELAEKRHEAFKALPESYRNDSCLEFWEMGDYVYARPRVNQLSILGNWNAVYHGGKWKMIDTFAYPLPTRKSA